MLCTCADVFAGMPLDRSDQMVGSSTCFSTHRLLLPETIDELPYLPGDEKERGITKQCLQNCGLPFSTGFYTRDHSPRLYGDFLPTLWQRLWMFVGFEFMDQSYG